VALNEPKSILAPRQAGIFDGVVLAIVTLAALFCCYEVEVFPTDSKPHTLELDELLLVSTIFCAGLFICALRLLAEQQRRINRIIDELTAGMSWERLLSFPFDDPKVKCRARSVETAGTQPVPRVAQVVCKWGAPTPGGRPSKNAVIEAAIDKLTAEGINLSKLPRKDAHSRICQAAATLGVDVEVGFSYPVIRRVLVRRYGPRS
jgi:hypothetical protein